LSRKREAQLKALESLSFSERASLRLKAIPWKRYAFFGILGPILIPVWIVIACSTISVQGYNSRRRTKPIVDANPELDRVRDEALVTRTSTDVSTSSSRRLTPQRTVSHTEHHHDNKSKTTTHITTFQNDTQADSSVTLAINESTSTPAKQSSPSSPQASTLTDSTVETLAGGLSEEEEVPISYSFPHLKQIQPLGLLPAQIEISRNLNTLEWKKNIIHIEAMNAHASIVVREGRFSNDGGIAAVQHAVDMFKDDGEDE